MSILDLPWYGIYEAVTAGSLSEVLRVDRYWKTLSVLHPE